MHTTDRIDLSADLSPSEIIENFKDRLPVFDNLCIGVNGQSGGSGNTYFSIAIAVAALSAGLKIAFCVSHRECNNNWVNYFEDFDFEKSNLKIYNSIESCIVDLEVFLPQIIVIDLPSGTYSGYMYLRAMEEIASQFLDVLVHPAALDQPFHLDEILRNIDLDEPIAYWRRLISPLCNDINPFHLLSEFKKLKKHAAIVSDVFLYEGNCLTYDLDNSANPVNFIDYKSAIRYESLLARIIEISQCNSIGDRRKLFEKYSY